MSNVVTLRTLPECYFCSAQGARNPKGATPKAQYDYKTTHGSWAYGCRTHYWQYRAYKELGTGKGQKLVVAAVTN